MALELIDCSKIEITGALPKSAKIVGAYYLGYGRNAWYSTWVNLYIPRSVATDFTELKHFAEKQRVQGSVFKILAIPMLVLRYEKNTFAIAPINDASKYEYDKLIESISNDALPNFWSHLPSKSQNWLLTFTLTADSLKDEKKFSPILWGSQSGGTHHSLAWSTRRPAPEYKLFLDFADRFVELFERKSH